MRNKIYWQLGLVFILLIILYALWPLPFYWFGRKIISPAVYGTESLLKRIASPFETLSKIRNLDWQNKLLEQENAKLRAEIISATAKANTCLSQLKEQEAQSGINLPAIQANVIGKSPFSFNQSFIINRGSKDGVVINQAVTANGFFLGKVISVDGKSAIVKLVTSHDSIVPAISVKNRQSGLVQGGLEGLLMTDVPIDAQVEEGETVTTSGMGGELPAGIPIGTISKIETKSGGLFKIIRVNYPLNPNNVEVVSIIKI